MKLHDRFVVPLHFRFADDVAPPDKHCAGNADRANQEYTRVVIQLDREVKFRKEILSNPDRIYFDLQKAQLAKVEMNMTIASVKQRDCSLEVFDVQVDCLGGAPVSGYLAKPKGAKPKSLPAILWVHGAGWMTGAWGW